jgi:hypothetical protein
MQKESAPRARSPKSDRWAFGTYYLDQPWPDRGGIWYACTYDAGTRGVRRQSLHTADFEEAKTKLVGLVAAAPVSGEAPSPKNVLCVRIFESYLDGHATTIRTTEAAERAIALAAEWLETIRSPTAKVTFWTPSRQTEFARWLVDEKHLAAGTIERTFTVIGAAFKDAAKVKMRDMPLKGRVESALIAYAPEITMKRSNIAKELKIAPPKKGGYVPTLYEMAKFIDLQKSEHLRRWTILSLTTWARPEAVADFDPALQSNPTTGIVDLNPPGRPQTNKFRPRIATPQSLDDWLDEWSFVDGEAWKEKNGVWPEGSLPLLMFKQKRVANVKKGIKRLGDRNGLPNFTQYTPRRFMATTIRKLCPNIPREKRSLWLGHSVEGSRTTDHYENFDREVVEDVAIGTDFIMAELQKLCTTRLLAVELQLNKKNLARIGAKTPEKTNKNQDVNGGRYRDRCHPWGFCVPVCWNRSAGAQDRDLQRRGQWREPAERGSASITIWA